MAARRIRLPRPDTKGAMPLEQALLLRRSVRDYTREPVTRAETAQLLWAAQGITSPEGDRTAPSAGALFPLELYLVAGKVDGLEPGAYRYRPKGHALLQVAEGDLRTAIGRASLGQSWVRLGAALIVFTAVYERVTAEYDEPGRRYVEMEVGFAAENVHLQAAALGLGTVFVAAFHEKRVAELLHLPADHVPLGLMPVGRPWEAW